MRRRFLNSIKSTSDDLEYFTIEALENGLTAKLSTNACEYRIDDGSWISLSSNTNTSSINKGQTLSFRGNLIPKESYGIGTFTISKNCNLKGNIMSLLYGDDFVGQTNLSSKKFAFLHLFKFCTTIIDASKLILPATTLAEYCYSNMFYKCTGLITSPKLRATTLANNCYHHMFYGTNVLPDCSNIDFTSNTVVASRGLKGLFAGTKVTDNDLYNILPINSNNGKYYLPATTLASDCYNSMFSGCTSLVTAPELPATTLTDNCYNSMFYGCTSLVTAPELPATTLAPYCYYYMFYKCTSLVTAPELPATTLTSYCYATMFYKCTSLTTAPELPATELVPYCYNSMFLGCKKLNKITMLATDISAANCLLNWVRSVSSTGTFIKHPNVTSLPTGASGIPSGWTVVDYESGSGGSSN